MEAGGVFHGLKDIEAGAPGKKGENQKNGQQAGTDAHGWGSAVFRPLMMALGLRSMKSANWRRERAALPI
jgi:hypothetical protein